MDHTNGHRTATREEALRHEEICTFLKKKNFYIREPENYHSEGCPDRVRVHEELHRGDIIETYDHKAKTHEGHEWLVDCGEAALVTKKSEYCHTEGCEFQKLEEKKERKENKRPLTKEGMMLAKGKSIRPDRERRVRNIPPCGVTYHGKSAWTLCQSSLRKTSRRK
jgi:hypothetical protein